MAVGTRLVLVQRSLKFQVLCSTFLLNKLKIVLRRNGYGQNIARSLPCCTSRLITAINTDKLTAKILLSEVKNTNTFF